MRRIVLFTFFMMLFVIGAIAQEVVPLAVDSTGWMKKGMASLNLSQTNLTNWAAGGSGSIAGDALFNYGIDYRKDKKIWQNRLELAYGLNKTETNGLRKTNDKIYLNSMYGYNIDKTWYVTAFINFQTQFTKGYDYAVTSKRYISMFMSPGYLSSGPSITWMPKKWFMASLSPATWRGTFVTDKRLSLEGDFGVDKGKHFLSEFGATLKMETQLEFITNFKLYSRLVFFSDYLHKPENIDIFWNLQLNMKISRIFSASLTINMVYDDDVKFLREDGSEEVRLQFKETLGIGLQYNF